jgi:hypothetical protein
LQFNIVVSNNQDVDGSVPTDVELTAIVEYFSPIGASVDDNNDATMSDPNCPEIATKIGIQAGSIIGPGGNVIIESEQVNVNTCLCPQFVFTAAVKGVPVTNTTSPDDRQSTTNDSTVCTAVTSFKSPILSASS